MIRAACDCDCGVIDLAAVELSPACFEPEPPSSFELSFSGSWRVAVVNGMHLPLVPGADGTSHIMLCDQLLAEIGPLEKAEIVLMR